MIHSSLSPCLTLGNRSLLSIFCHETYLQPIKASSCKEVWLQEAQSNKCRSQGTPKSQAQRQSQVDSFCSSSIPLIFLQAHSVSFLYSRKERLSTRFEYLSVKESGSSFRYNHFWLQLKANNLEYSRLGVIASKRVGNAVKRNQAKRIIRELFRKYRSHILVPSDVVVLARSSITKLSFSELEQLFIKALRKSSCHL